MITELCIDVINAFNRLQATLQLVEDCVCIMDAHLPAWFDPPLGLGIDQKLSVRQQVCVLLRQLEYISGQAPREILVGAGLVAASAETVTRIDELNRVKELFKRAILALKAAKGNHAEILNRQFEGLLPQRDELVASKLARMGLARLHLKQCYRKIPYFTRQPLKVSWTWANTRSIIKITVADAEKLLLKHTMDEGIIRQLGLLRALPSNEKLAIIQELAPHLRANVVLPANHSMQRVMVKGPIPIFYVSEDNTQLPQITPAGLKRGKNKERLTRNDVKINPEPFLPAIHAHRYLQPSTV